MRLEAPWASTGPLHTAPASLRFLGVVWRTLALRNALRQPPARGRRGGVAGANGIENTSGGGASGFEDESAGHAGSARTGS